MTIKDVARLANVSPSTVSKIINGKADHIRPETREMVLKIVRQYHYSPSNYIRQISHERSYKIGVLINEAFDNNQFLHSLATAAKDEGYYPIICCSDGDPDTEERFLSFIAADGVDGLIWEQLNPDSSRRLNDKKIPCLLINSDAETKDRFPFYSYGFFAAEKLIRAGHQRIAFLAGMQRAENEQIFLGVQAAMKAHLLDASDSYWMYPSQVALDLIREGFTAAICMGEKIAVALSRKMLLLHQAIPHDFSVLVLSSQSSENHITSDFSTVSIPYEEYGNFLIKHLINLIDGSPETVSFIPTPPDEPSNISIAAPKDRLALHMLVIGSIHMDTNINTATHPQPGKAVMIQTLNSFPGGKGVNQAIGLAKLQKDVYLIGRFGSDFDGVTVKDTLVKNHVRTDGLIRDSSSTGRAFVNILANGESAITFYSGANSNLSIADIQNNQHLFPGTSYCLLQTEIPMDVVEYSARLAKQNHAKVVLKPSSITKISDTLLTMVDYFIPNENEINNLCPQEHDYAAKCHYFLQKGVGAVILTLGREGCLLCTPDEQRYFPASNHVVVDTTGGCDAFIAALVALLSEGADLHKAIYYANCAAGFCVSQPGVVPALIDRTALELYPYYPENTQK